MAERIISEETINAFREYLVLEEKSTATVEKYLRDVRAFHFQEREAVGPEQYLGADEIPLRGSRSKSQQGVSPQSAQAVCPDFLRY